MADEFESEFDSSVADFVRKDFYLDDGLKYVVSISDAIHLINGAKAMCCKAGLRLHKFASNAKESYPRKEQVKERLTFVGALKSATFRFRTVLHNKPLPRRGIMSTVCFIYGPLGFIALVVLLGSTLYNKFVRIMPVMMIRFKPRCIYRCVKRSNFGMEDFIISQMLVSLGMDNCLEMEFIVHWQWQKDAHLKVMTVPRLELTAALVSIKVGKLLEDELGCDKVSHFYYTDRLVVLGYISNDSKRYHVFVAKNVQQIRDSTATSQWKYVKSEEKPADIASRGTTVTELTKDPSYFVGIPFFGRTNILPVMLNLQHMNFWRMAERAVHLETANSPETSYSINALTLCLAIRGPVRYLRSDRGTNIVGAERELKEALESIDSDQICEFLLKEGCDLHLKMNVPAASHMGGVWERQISCIRNVLASLMDHCGTLVDDEELRTFMCEAANMVNCRPLSVEFINDLAPLSPQNHLTLKSK
ncbi:hypothetical protein MAR_001809, partial [Mya arenaria]